MSPIIQNYIWQTYVLALLIHILWNVLPYALDRALAGELPWREIPAYIAWQLSVDAGSVEVGVDQSSAPFTVTPAADLPTATLEP